MGYTRHYGKIADLAARDEAAISDTKDYLGEERFELLSSALTACGSDKMVQDMNIAFSFAGVSGLPFHAMCRKYCLEAYREWMHSGDDGTALTDERGYRIE
jgi:hypothetical protein